MGVDSLVCMPVLDSVTKALLSERCRVVLADWNATAMERVIQNDSTSRDSGSTDSLLVECNVTDVEQVRSLIQRADDFAASNKCGAEKFATLLVNCAGITRDNWVSKMSLEEWDIVMDVNLKGTFLTCRYFLDQERLQRLSSLQTNTSLSIVNVGSIVSEYGNVGQVNYAASKGGVVGLTKALAKETAKRHVRVNAVLPGFIDTPMAQAVPDTVKAQIILPKIPVGRFGRPEEVADAVSFLLSPRSSYITGESIRVSGMISL